MSTFEDRVAALEAEFEAVEKDLSDPATLADPDRVRDLSRRHKELGEIVRTWRDLTGRPRGRRPPAGRCSPSPPATSAS